MRKIDYFMSNPDRLADAIDEYLNVAADYFSSKTVGELVAGYLLMNNDSNTVIATTRKGDAVKCDLFKTVTKPENYHTPADTLDCGAFEESQFDFNTSIGNNIIDNYGEVISKNIIKYFLYDTFESVGEITVPKIEDGVVYYGGGSDGKEGYISGINGMNYPFEAESDTEYEITFYDGSTVTASADGFIPIRRNTLPEYKYMYVMTVSPTVRKSFIKALSMCGFRVYAVDGIGYVFGYDTPTGYGVPTKQEVTKAFCDALMYWEAHEYE